VAYKISTISSNFTYIYLADDSVILRCLYFRLSKGRDSTFTFGLWLSRAWTCTL